MPLGESAVGLGERFRMWTRRQRADATVIRQTDGVQLELKKADIETRTMPNLSAMPEGLAANLTPEQLADLIASLQSLK